MQLACCASDRKLHGANKNGTNVYFRFLPLVPKMLPVVYADSEVIQGYAAEQKEKLRNRLKSGTGMDRVRRMYSFDEMSQPSPELLYIMKGGYISLFMGVVFGGLGAAHEARENFMRRNAATAFESEHLARRQLTDSISLAAFRGACKNGFKLGAFTTVYLGICLTAANYNNKSTVFEHMAAGALFGGLLKFNYGLKGMAVASGLGGVLGLCAGGLTMLSLKIAGTNFEEFRLWLYEYYTIKLKPEESLTSASLESGTKQETH